jgi:hypothetical protein
LDAERERAARPIPKDRSDRLFEACRRLEEEFDVEQASHGAYDAWRARGVAADGSRRMAPGMVKPHEPALVPEGLMNTTDLDSRPMRTHGYKPLQGYNAQLAVNEQQVVIAAELTCDSPDFGHLEPMVDATRRELHAVGLDDPGVVLADAGYWHKRQMEHIVSDGITVLVPPDAGLRKGARPGWDGGLCVHAPRLGDPRRPSAIPPAPGHHQTRLWPDQVQPRHQTLPTPRQSRLQKRMEAHRHHPQPAQAPQPASRGGGTLKISPPELDGPSARTPPSRPRRALRASTTIYPTASGKRSSRAQAIRCFR